MLTNIIVVDEVIWILNKKYGIEISEIFEFLDRVLNFITFVPLEGEDYEIAKEHVACMKKAGYIVSEDQVLIRVDWIRRYG